MRMPRTFLDFLDLKMLSAGYYTTGQIRTLEREKKNIRLNTNIKIKHVGGIYIYVLSCYHTLSLQFSFLHTEIKSLLNHFE